MQVYIVFKGTYSDRHIEEVFSSLEAAELYIELHSPIDLPYEDEYSVEEFEVDSIRLEEIISERVDKLYGWEFVFDPFGIIMDKKFGVIFNKDIENTHVYDHCRGGNGNLSVFVLGYKDDNVDLLTKIARDTRSKYLADKFGVSL